MNKDIDDLLKSLSNTTRRNIIKFLIEVKVTTKYELIEQFPNKRVEIIHTHLPVLEDSGIIVKEGETIRYVENEYIEEVISVIH